MGKGHYLGGSTIIRLGPRPSGGKHLSHFIKKEGYLSKLVKEVRLENYQRPETHPDIPAARKPPRREDVEAPKQRPYSKGARKSPPKYTQGLDKHFAYGARTRESQLRQLGPILKACAVNGIKQDRDIAVVLNKSGHRTACGDKWTPLLVHFLRKFWAERTQVDRRSPSPTPQTKMVRQTQLATTPNQMTGEDLAARLSLLGRVTKSE